MCLGKKKKISSTTFCPFFHIYFFPQVEYISKTHIYAVLEEISDTVLIVLPEDQVCTVEYLLETNKVTLSLIFHNFVFFKSTLYFEPPK